MKINYHWDNVVIGGGGYVTGIVANPAEKDLIFIRTDVGGAYRWDKTGKSFNKNQGKWLPLTDNFSFDNWNLYGVDGMASSASEPDILYAALGKYTENPGGVFRSNDKGETWEKVLEINCGSNMIDRCAGECLSINPVNSQKVIFGSRNNGLFKTENGGESWDQFKEIPQGEKDIGIRTVLWVNDKLIFGGVSGSGIYCSVDGGNNFRYLQGSPEYPFRMTSDSENNLYVSYKNAGIARFLLKEKSWQEISPDYSDVETYTGITIDPEDDNHILCNARGKKQKMTLPFWESFDGGESWFCHKNGESVEWLNKISWWSSRKYNSQPSAIIFDHFKNQKAWFTDWYGIYRAEGLGEKKIKVYSEIYGHEELVIFDMLCTPQGANLLTGCADNGGLYHEDIYDFPEICFSQQETTGLDFCEKNPQFVARVSSDGWGKRNFNFYISTDGGKNWDKRNNPGKNGKIACSATDIDNLVYMGREAQPLKYSRDGGYNWLVSDSPETEKRDFWDWNEPIASDRYLDGVFYYFHKGSFYVSTNGGENWIQVNSCLPEAAGGGKNYIKVKALPFLKSNVLLSLGANGLFKTEDGGYSFEKVNYFEISHLIASGKPEPGSNNPTIFVYGKANNKWGVFCSFDKGESWMKINKKDKLMGNDPNSMAADRQKSGRVYIGTNGRGIYYGEPDIE